MKSGFIILVFFIFFVSFATSVLADTTTETYFPRNESSEIAGYKKFNTTNPAFTRTATSVIYIQQQYNCSADKWLTNNFTSQTGYNTYVNGTWTFYLNKTDNRNAAACYPYAAFLYYNKSSGTATNFLNSSQASSDACTGGAGLVSWSYNLQSGNYILEPGDRIGIRYCVNVSSGTGAYTFTVRFNNTHTNVTFPYEIIGPPAILNANGTITGKNPIYTGNESSQFTGSCEANNGTANNVYIILQNSTDNISFTTITTGNTQPIYTNVSSYSIGHLTDANSTNFYFQVNATIPRNYTLRAQCSATYANNTAANTTGANLTVNQAFGYLNVTLLNLTAGSSTNITQNATFNIIANVSCASWGANPTAKCEQVNGTARRNSTANGPDTNIPQGSGTPFWTTQINPQTCGFLNYADNCSLNWTVNASGPIGTTWMLDVNFTSNWTVIVNNDTENFNINITAPTGVSIAFTLYIPATNATKFSPGQVTPTIFFNTTDTTAIMLNASNCPGCAAVQTANLAIFNFTNTGNQLINISMNFSVALPAGVTVKAGWANSDYQQACTQVNKTSTAGCVNITASLNRTRIANLSTSGPGQYREVWLWADFSNVASGVEAESNISHISVAGT